MRIRQWLLTGTSLAVFTFMPGAVMAQQAEYQALQDAQASGDQNAIDAAKLAFNEACIAAGYASPDECVAALSGGGQSATDADAEAAAKAEADAKAAADAEAAAKAEADAKAQADAEAAAKAEADAKAAADAQAAADAEAAAKAEADAKAAANAQAAADAKAAADAQAAADAKAAADAQAAADAKAAADAQAAADAEAAAKAQAEADAKAAADAQAAADAEAAAKAAAEQQQAAPPAAEQPAAPAQPSAEDQQAQFVAALQAALDEYQAALNQAAGGDYAGGKAAADAAAAKILDLCTTNGYPDIKSCIGQDLPPVPEAPAAEQPAAPADQAPAAEQPAAPADQAPGAEVGPEQPAVEAPANDPAAAAQAQLQTALELYNVGIGQLDAGDASGQSTIDAANKQFADICAGLGQSDVAACLAQYGIVLAPVPAVKAPAEPATPPIADLPGANEAVTPDAVEVLPEAVAPEAAAPILDSAKDVQAEVAKGETPAEQPAAPAEPAGPPPADDKAAQAAIAPVEVQSIKETQGEAVAVDALAPIEVPQNVTIINNTTIINNNTVINNGGNGGNGGGNGGGGNNGGNGPGGNGPGGDRPGKPRPDYANNGFIFNIGINLVIQSNDFDRLSNDDEDDVEYQRLSGGRIKETITRPNGVQIVTIRNRYGEVLKRSRITPNGREYILAYYDEDDEDDNDFGNWRDPGNDLPPLRLTIPIKDYILDADDSDEEDVELFFRQPPVEKVREIYTIDDVKKSARLRDSVRRVEVGGLTFDSGAATISRSQVGALSKVANAMLKLLEDNPAETFLIEGHTDAVGGDQANLILSDARATTVARILTDFYDVPAENLVTQGYGERFLKVKTEKAEPLNRRVSIKRITPLITLASNN